MWTLKYFKYSLYITVALPVSKWNHFFPGLWGEATWTREHSSCSTVPTTKQLRGRNKERQPM